MAWYLNRALTGFRAAVNAAYPNRDKASDGTIGDAAHKAGTSDHNEDPDGSVDAWDMDVDLRSDNDAAAIERLKKVFQAHPRPGTGSTTGRSRTAPPAGGASGTPARTGTTSTCTGTATRPPRTAPSRG